MIGAIVLGARIASLLLWWRAQGRTWTKWNSTEEYWYTDGNAYEKAEHEFRCKLGPALRPFFPGRSHCRECGMPWGIVNSMSVWYSDDSGIGVLCHQCWHHLARRSGGEERIVSHFKSHVEQHWADEKDTWPEIEYAVRRYVYHVSHRETQPKDCQECDRVAKGGSYFRVTSCG